MIDEQNLKGTVVMLHPEMWQAHADKEGVVGEIVKADPARDDFYVNTVEGLNLASTAQMP